MRRFKESKKTHKKQLKEARRARRAAKRRAKKERRAEKREARTKEKEARANVPERGRYRSRGKGMRGGPGMIPSMPRSGYMPENTESQHPMPSTPLSEFQIPQMPGAFPQTREPNPVRSHLNRMPHFDCINTTRSGTAICHGG